MSVTSSELTEKELLLKELDRVIPLADLAWKNTIKISELESDYKKTELTTDFKGYDPFGLTAVIIVFGTAALGLYFAIQLLFFNFSTLRLAIYAILTFLCFKVLKYGLWKIETTIAEAKNKQIDAHNNKVSEKIKGTVAILDEETSKALRLIVREGIIPKDYIHPDILIQFKKYLLNLRADNLKECVNLYEAEKSKGIIVENQNRLLQKQIETNRNLEYLHRDLL